MLSAPKPHGFTLIELITAIAVLSILLGIAVPAFQAWVLNTKIRTTAEAMLNGLQLARAEAARRNERVRFTLSGGTGWTVQTNGGVQIQARPSAEGSRNVSVTKTPASATSVTFNALGLVVANADTSASITQLDIDASGLEPGQSRELRVLISSGSLVRMCDPAIPAASGDPRAC